MTAFAASFMRSKALRSFGFSNEYLLANLVSTLEPCPSSRLHDDDFAYLVKPRPSILTTTHVFGKRTSGCSNCFTYSHLRASESEELLACRCDEVKRTLSWPC